MSNDKRGINLSNLAIGISGVNRGFIEALQPVIGFDPRLDPTDGNGIHTTDGTGAITLEVSVGTGKGASKLSIAGADNMAAVSKLISEFSGETRNEELPDDPVECFKRTARKFSRDGQDYLGFKVSMAPNTREIRIPWSEREQFASWLANPTTQWSGVCLSDATTQLVEHARAAVLAAQSNHRTGTPVPAPTRTDTPPSSSSADLAGDLVGDDDTDE